MSATDAPSHTERSRWRRLASPVFAGAVVAGAVVALHLRDPHESGSWGFCPSAALGIYCPGCGGLRAVNDLSNFDIAGAASSNLLLVVAIPIVVAFWLRRLVACWRGGAAMAPVPLPTYLAVALVALVTVFGVVRNFPFGSWLAP